MFRNTFRLVAGNVDLTPFIRSTFVALLALAAVTAQAQGFPTKAIRIIVPFAPGGANDLMARYVCERFPQALGQPCVVENRTGAGGMIGIDAVAKAEPDGHTLLMVPNNIVTIPLVYAKVPPAPGAAASTPAPRPAGASANRTRCSRGPPRAVGGAPLQES